MSKQKEPVLRKSSDYGMFTFFKVNRGVELDNQARRDMRRDMQLFGFNPAAPLECVRRDGRLVIKNGQHRFCLAQELRIPVYYVVTDRELSAKTIADDSKTSKPWNTRDYAVAFAKDGREDYKEVLEFSERNKITVSDSAGILANTGTGNNVMRAFRDGEYRIKTREMADRVAHLYNQIGGLSKDIKSRFFLLALYAVCQIPDGVVDFKRLVRGAHRCPGALLKYGDRIGFLQMLEHIYNYGYTKRFPLRIEAENAMAAKNCVGAKEKRESESEAKRK